MCENIFIYPKTIPTDYISLEQTGNSKTFANYRYYASHCSQPFFATGDYDGSIKLWRLEENGFKHPNFEKFLLKSRFLTITNIVFHKSLSFKLGQIPENFGAQVAKLPKFLQLQCIQRCQLL